MEDYDDEDFVFIWPENRRAFLFFQSAVGTRWVSGPNGVPTGLRWEALYPLMDRLGLAPDDWESLRADIEVMERAALAEIHQQQK